MFNRLCVKVKTKSCDCFLFIGLKPTWWFPATHPQNLPFDLRRGRSDLDCRWCCSRTSGGLTGFLQIFKLILMFMVIWNPFHWVRNKKVQESLSIFKKWQKKVMNVTVRSCLEWLLLSAATPPDLTLPPSLSVYSRLDTGTHLYNKHHSHAFWSGEEQLCVKIWHN